MKPEISIIIPVYNTEKYLTKCLDSVLEQAFGNFEVLCVDHSSTDGSLAILQEYTRKDARIKIIPCVNTNGGPGQARNAALNHVRGKYTYFCDSDDWTDPTLCEKAYYRLEQSGVDVVFFSYHRAAEKGDKITQNRSSNVRQRMPTLIMPDYFRLFTVPWNRMIRTDFLRKINFRFPEGQLPEDNYLHWVLLVHKPKTEIIFEELYFHLRRTGSQMTLRGENMAKFSHVCFAIKQYLQKIGKYEQYRKKLLIKKYRNFASFFPRLRKGYRAKSVEWLRETIDKDEIHFLTNERSLDAYTRNLVLALLSGSKIRVWSWQAVHMFKKRVIGGVLRPIKLLIKSMMFRKKLYEQKIDELNALLAARDKEIVELRESFAQGVQTAQKKAA